MKKSNGSWLVFREVAGVKAGALTTFEHLYSGPDRNKARDKASAALEDGRPVTVVRASRTVRLQPSSLVASLPRKAF